MKLDMLLQIALLSEAFAAEFARMRLQFCVDSRVDDKIPGLGKLFPTVLVQTNEDSADSFRLVIISLSGFIIEVVLLQSLLLS